MAHETGEQNRSMDADLDQLEVELVILAKHPKALAPAAAYLGSQGWTTTVYGSLTKALTHLRERNPDFFVVSFNYPNPELDRLPDALAKFQNLTCVGFVEQSDEASAGLLTSVKIAHKIFGQPSGPNIYRGLRRVVASLLGLPASDNPRAAMTTGGTTVIATEPNREPSDTVVQSSTNVPNQSTILNADARRTRARLKDLLARTRGAAATQEEPLVRATERAFNEICGSRKGKSPSQSTGPVKKAAVFALDSHTHPGYLIVAINPDQLTDRRSFAKACAGAIQKALHLQGLKGKLEDAVWTDIPSMDFEGWAPEVSRFNFRRIYSGAEMGVAFLDVEGSLPKPQESSVPGMYTLKIKNIPPGEPVSFKVFLYLPENRKCVLYLRAGSQLYGDQRERLIKNKINEVFIEEEDVDSARAFLASSYVRIHLQKKANAPSL